MKLCKRRGLPMDELWTVVGKLLNGEQLEEKNKLTSWQATVKVNGNVTYSPTGYLFGKYAIKSLFSYS